MARLRFCGRVGKGLGEKLGTTEDAEVAEEGLQRNARTEPDH